VRKDKTCLKKKTKANAKSDPPSKIKQ